MAHHYIEFKEDGTSPLSYDEWFWNWENMEQFFEWFDKKVENGGGYIP